jgi:5-methylcytosine-specific restriction endonuclease McrA
MPTTQHKGKKLLREGKAHVVQRYPFTIQLNYATGETTQPIKLGIDPGYMKIGFSATTDKLEVISGTLTLRKDVSSKLQERRRYRRARRGRLRYRKARFNNRTRPEGWLPPSIQHKKESHIRLVEKLVSLLPIIATRVEVENFDTQKMQQPEIKGLEYQQGELQGYEVKEYLLEKWGRKCVYCGKTNVPVEVEHLIPKSRGGTDRVSNLTISCRKCNLKKGDKTANEFGYPHLQYQAQQPLKGPACLNNIRWKVSGVVKRKVYVRIRH